MLDFLAFCPKAFGILKNKCPQGSICHLIIAEGL